MVKDEDVCLHCGLCAERCPTGAWDMQKFLLDMTHAGTHASKAAGVRPQRQRLRRQVRQRQRLGLGQRQRAVRQVDPAHGRAGGAPRNIFPSNIQGLPTWYEVRVSEAGSRRARRRRPDGGDEPADLGQGRRRHRARRLPVLRFHQADAASKFRDDITVLGVPLTEICNANTPTRASASCSRTSSMSARCRRCSTSTRK
jgi:ferredoxin